MEGEGWRRAEESEREEREVSRLPIRPSQTSQKRFRWVGREELGRDSGMEGERIYLPASAPIVSSVLKQRRGLGGS